MWDLVRGVLMSEVSASSLVLFQALSQACALPIQDVVEVVPLAQLTQLAGQPSLLDGFLNLRGEMIPVIPLWRLLNGAPVEARLDSPILIVRAPGAVAGLLVDRVDGVADEFEPLSERSSHLSFNECAQAEVRVDGVPVTVLDAQRLLLEEERQCLAQFAASAQDRLRSLTEAGS